MDKWLYIQGISLQHTVGSVWLISLFSSVATAGCYSTGDPLYHPGGLNENALFVLGGLFCFVFS